MNDIHVNLNYKVSATIEDSDSTNDSLGVSSSAPLGRYGSDPPLALLETFL
jgi:hypothetical protein